MAVRSQRMPMSVRQAKIREVLQKKQSVGIHELADALGVSEMTVRRDLARLERGGEVRRTHGSRSRQTDKKNHLHGQRRRRLVAETRFR